MTDREPTLTITLNGGEKMEAKAENTTVYTFLGQTAIGSFALENASVNHVFIKTEENKGMYFFEQFHGDAYKTIAQFAIAHAFPLRLNSREVPECDVRAYMLHQDAEAEKFAAALPDELPEDFK